MGIRETLNENQNIVVVAAVVVTVTALIYIGWQSSGGGGVPRGRAEVYYKDVVTGEVFTADADAIPPIQSPEGNEAVQVQFFSCTESCGGDDRFVGYYVKFTDEMKQRLEEQRRAAREQSGDEMMAEETMYELWEESERARLYALPEEGEQLDLAGDEAWAPMLELTQAVERRLTCEDGNRARPCYPR